MMKYILIFFLLVINTRLLPQTFTVSGIVTDVSGKPLPGVNIIVEGTSAGTATNDDGKYTLQKLSPGDYKIRFSFIGFREEVRDIRLLTEDAFINVILKEEAIETGRVIVTAGKHEQEISELPVSAEILPGEEILSKNVTNLKQAMKYIPGVNMTDDQVSIRGSSGYSRGAGTRVLLAIDGIPYYTGDTGEIIWEIIPVTQIERVEVIKGSASALYGSTAIGGVINIITKNFPDKPQTYVRTLIGAYDKPAYKKWDWSGEYRKFNGLTLAHSNSFDNFSFSAALTRLEDEGYRQSGFYHRYLGYFKGVYNISASSSINIIFNSINSRNGNFIYWKNSRNALVPPDADQGQRVESNRYMTAAVFKTVVHENLFLDVKLSYYRNHWQDQSVSANKSGSNLVRGEVQTTYSLNKNIIIVSGAEGIFSSINSNIFSNRTSYGTGIYSQADITFSFPLLLNIGARFDFNQLDTVKYFTNFSPKIGFNYDLASNLIIRGSLGTGFRAPSLAETFTTTTVSLLTVEPNPAIKPERSLTYELGLNYQPFSGINFDVSGFNNEYYDFIEPMFKTGNRIIFNNITRAAIKGFEVNTGFQVLNNLKLAFNYSYLWARDLDRHIALKFRPRHIGSASVEYILNNFEAGANITAWKKVEEIDPILEVIIPDGKVRSDVFVLDVRGSYKFADTGFPLRLTLAVNNILNYNYVELTGNLAPIRNFSLSAELLF